MEIGKTYMVTFDGTLMPSDDEIASREIHYIIEEMPGIDFDFITVKFDQSFVDRYGITEPIKLRMLAAGAIKNYLYGNMDGVLKEVTEIYKITLVLTYKFLPKSDITKYTRFIVPPYKFLPEMSQKGIQRLILKSIGEMLRFNPYGFIDEIDFVEIVEIDRLLLRDHLELLAENGFIALDQEQLSNFKYRINLTSRGRMAIREPNFQEDGISSSTVNVLNVIDSQIRNLSQTGASANINQTQESTSLGLDEIYSIIEELIETVENSDIEPEVKSDYALDAQNLKRELQNSRPNLSRIRDILSVLGDVDGVLGLASRLAPLVIALQLLIEKLFTK